MKKIVTALFAVLLSATLLYAQDTDSYYTDNHINGRFWKTMEFPEKLYYLYGMIDGVTVISESKSVFDEAHNIRPDVSKIILSGTGRFFIPRGNYKDIVKYIDGFYSDGANLNLPVYAAYTQYLAKQKDWNTLSGWSEALKGLRQSGDE